MILHQKVDVNEEMEKTEDESEDTDTSDTSITSDSDSNDGDEVPENPNEDSVSDDDDAEDLKDDGEEEEDEVIKAIRKENDRQRDHPPIIKLEDLIVDISFSPTEDLLAVASVSGDVLLYKYSNEENTLLSTWELHTKACRDVEFSQDGKLVYSVAKDKSIMITNIEDGKLNRFYDKAHDAAIYSVAVLDENLFATGDDDGTVKLWDAREKQDKAVFSMKKNTEFISDIVSNEDQHYMVCSSGDGSITSVDLRMRQFFMQSEEYEEEFTCLGLFRTETKLLAGSSKGKMYLFNWNEFGYHSDLFPGVKSVINSMIPVTENIVVTACEDGNLRATHLFPHRQLGIVGQHNLSVESIDINNNGEFIATSSLDNDIKFWNIKYFEDFDKIKIDNNKKSSNKRKATEFNLPSSKKTNVADFFSDLQ